MIMQNIYLKKYLYIRSPDARRQHAHVVHNRRSCVQVSSMHASQRITYSCSSSWNNGNVRCS